MRHHTSGGCPKLQKEFGQGFFDYLVPRNATLRTLYAAHQGRSTKELDRRVKRALKLAEKEDRLRRLDKRYSDRPFSLVIHKGWVNLRRAKVNGVATEMVLPLFVNQKLVTSKAKDEGRTSLEREQAAMRARHGKSKEAIMFATEPIARLKQALEHCVEQERKATTPEEQLKWTCFIWLLKRTAGWRLESEYNTIVQSEVIETLVKRPARGELTVRCKVEPVSIKGLAAGLSERDEPKGVGRVLRKSFGEQWG